MRIIDHCSRSDSGPKNQQARSFPPGRDSVDHPRVVLLLSHSRPGVPRVSSTAFRKSLSSCCLLSSIWPGGIEDALIQLGPGAEPCPTVLLLGASPAERRVADQGLAGVGPAIGMGVMRVVVLHESPEPRLEVGRRAEVALGEEPSREGTEPELDLVQPAAVLGREIEDMLMGRVAQEGPPLRRGAAPCGPGAGRTTRRSARRPAGSSAC